MINLQIPKRLKRLHGEVQNFMKARILEMSDLYSKELWIDAAKVGIAVATVLGEPGIELVENMNEKGKEVVVLSISRGAYEKAAGWGKYILEESAKIKRQKEDRDLISEEKVAAVKTSIIPEKGRSGYRGEVSITHEEFAVIVAAARGVKGAKFLERDSSGEKVRYGVDREIWAQLVGITGYHFSKAEDGDGFAREIYHSIGHIKERSYIRDKRDEGRSF